MTMLINKQDILLKITEAPPEKLSSNELDASRRLICGDCDQKTYDADVDLDKCTACGCYLELKYKFDQAPCPLKKWSVLPIEIKPIQEPSVAYVPPLPEGIEPVDPSKSSIVTLMSPLY